MKVLLDCDGVLSGFAETTIALLNNKFGTAYILDDIVMSYDIRTALDLDNDKSVFITREWEAKCFCKNLEFVPGAKEGVIALKQLANIVIVTAPMPGSNTWDAERRAWLASRLQLTSVISTDEKYHVYGDVIVDDLPVNLTKSLCKYRILFRRPWNKNYSLPDNGNFYSVNTWSQLVECVTAIKKLEDHAK